MNIPTMADFFSPRHGDYGHKCWDGCEVYANGFEEGTTICKRCGSYQTPSGYCSRLLCELSKDKYE